MPTTATGSMGLYNRIKEHVAKECAAVLGKQRFEHLIIFAGNGLTRIAGGPSWRNWLAACMRTVQSRQDLDYLRSLNYSLDHIFSLLIEEAQGNAGPLWKGLWNATKTIQPSPLHSALLQMTSDVLTTNYDTLFEIAADRENLNWRAFNLLAETQRMPAMGNDTIWKLHGSLPKPSESDSENDGIFNKWMSDGGPNETVATATTYHKWALKSSDDSFRQRFGRAVDLLSRRNTLVVFLGLGLGAEELVITRLLSLAASQKASPCRWVALEVTEELDSLYRLTRREIQPIRVPLGLCGSSYGRALATFALLECYALGHGPLPDPRNQLEVVRRCLCRWDCPVSATGTSLAESTPLVVSIGQSSVNKMLGLERGMAQEAAYGAKRATWTPEDGAAIRPLVSFEVGGQALIPTLVWDALGIPCGLISQVYNDDLGGKVLDKLQATTWLDCSGVKQLPKGEGFGWQTPRTEHATVATWFGVRTLLDTLDSRYPESFEVDRSLLDLEPRIVYVTKRGWERVREILPNHRGDEPLIVFETGGIGKLEAEVWVSQRRGIVIASAVAALAWMNEPVQEAIRSNPEDHGAISNARKRWSDERQLTEVKDDRGRVFQTKDVLDCVNEKTPLFLRTVLSGLRLYAITLGELGMIYWTEGDDVPKWCAPIAVIDGQDSVPDRHVRNGTECGDVTRAGFVASLLLLNSASVRASLASPNHVAIALAWACWFGACKLQFFSLDDYIDFLKRKASSILEAVRAGQLPGLGAATDFHDVDLRVDRAFDHGDLHASLKAWIRRTDQLRDKNNREPWEKRIREWVGARFPRDPVPDKTKA